MPKIKQTLPPPEIKDETLEILESESEKTDENDTKTEKTIENNDSIQAVKALPTVASLKPKRKATPAQIEKGRQNLEKGRLIKAELDKKKREEAECIALEEKKLKEEKLIKKAIAVKKKQLKKQAILDEISDDDDTPIQKIKEMVTKTKPVPVIPSLEPEKPKGPNIRFV